MAAAEVQAQGVEVPLAALMKDAAATAVPRQPPQLALQLAVAA